MASTHPIVDNLRRIAVLLAANGQDEHAGTFDRLADQFPEDADSTKSKVRMLFGGMGSFNDLVLHDRVRTPLQAENDELDRLRHELWELSQSSVKAIPD